MFDFAKKDRFPISLSKHLSDMPLQPINCNFYFAVLIANYSFDAYYRPYQLDLIERISPGGPKRSPHDCIILRRKLTSVDLR